MLLGCCCCAALAARELPSWWLAFPNLARLESPFTQESDSAVFGKLRRDGTLRLAQGGRLRVEYRKGMLLVCDGQNLVQYDPQARTAQRLRLRSAAQEAPLLNVLMNPKSLSATYEAKAGPEPGSVLLVPRKPGLPQVQLDGEQFLKRIQWTDGTGARQVILLQAPHLPGAFDPALFTFKAPAGTRWINTP